MSNQQTSHPQSTNDQRVVLNAKEKITKNQMKSAIVEALRKGVGEVHCVISKKGKVHFTSVMLDQFFELVNTGSAELARQVNSGIKA